MGLIHALVNAIAQPLEEAHGSSRIMNPPSGGIAHAAAFAHGGDAEQVRLFLDALDSHFPGCDATIYFDDVEAAKGWGIDPGEYPRLKDIRFEAIHEVAGSFDAVFLLHPDPYATAESRRALPAIRRVFDRANGARRWILFRDMELWNGSRGSRITRRGLQAIAFPFVKLRAGLERAILAQEVAPTLGAALAREWVVPCAHPAARRVFVRPRPLLYCPDCGMGLTPPGKIPDAEETDALYGTGYASFYRLTGARELARASKATATRLSGYLKRCGFESPVREGAPPPRVLDFGCGGGRMARLWIDLGFQYTGIDPSGPNIEFARSVCSGEDFALAEFIEGGLDHPRLAELAPFDVIFLSHVLEHVPDPAGLLADLRKLTRPEGWIYVEVPEASGFTWSAQWRGFAHTEHISDFTPPMLRALVRRAGWSVAGQCGELIVGSGPVQAALATSTAREGRLPAID